ncbi:odorant receptor 59b-like [Drosophila innubila]|uniref:odorant receptor 59b-like n=1 Tax=Drosophila innubila TaxID=198719 RepID=UPI00148D6138|nr:odorant receptor 59b-like [Drosophila innubila]
MAGMFRATHTAPLLVRVRSRECCKYLYRIMQFLGFFLSLILNFKILTAGAFLGVLQISANTVSAMIKAIIGLFCLSRLHKTEAVLDQLDDRLQNDSDRHKMHKAVARCNFIVFLYVILYLGYAASVFVAGILTGQPPWMVYFPLVNWQDGIGQYWIHSLIEYVLLSIALMEALVWDTYALVFITIFRAHVDILKDHIQHLRNDPNKTEADNYEDLVACIIDHKLILESCDLMRPVMSRTIFVQFLLIGIVLGIILINVLYFSDIYRAISSIVFFTGVMLETFPFCYFCDSLVDDCAELSNLLCQSNWLDAEPKYKLTLRIFLQNLQQPIIFIAGGIIRISVTSNINVAKFAFSVMTVVQNLNLADRFI